MSDAPPVLTARLPERALIRIEGADWRPFLHNLLTHDIENLPPGALRFTALLTPQGRLLHDLFVHAGETDAVLDIPTAGRDALLKRLSLYKLRAKVTLEPIEGHVHATWELTEPSPRDAGRGQGEGPLHLTELSERTPPGGAPHPDPLPPSAGRGSEHWRPDPRLPALGWRSVAHAGPATADAAAYDAHRLSLGVPDPALDARETDYPIDLNFDLLNGIDFKKGCFIGQETTSRMKRRGPVKTRAVPLVLNREVGEASLSKDEGPPPPPGTEVLAGDLRAGEIRSGRDGRAIALLRLDRAQGAALTAAGRPVRMDPPPWLTGAL